jgi:hypothetical protein
MNQEFGCKSIKERGKGFGFGDVTQSSTPRLLVKSQLLGGLDIQSPAPADRLRAVWILWRNTAKVLDMSFMRQSGSGACHLLRLVPQACCVTSMLSKSLKTWCCQ